MNIRQSFKNLCQRLRQRYQRFKQAQRTPVPCAPRQQAEVVCKNCGETFSGSYCPRCGQIASVARLSLVNMSRTFLNTWGAGDSSLFRTISHLLWRPGYMIGDYLDGHRRPYLQPFKTLFVVSAIFTLTYTFSDSIGRLSTDEPEKEINLSVARTGQSEATAASEANMSAEELKSEKAIEESIDSFENLFQAYVAWEKENRVWGELIQFVIFGIVAYYLLRRAPRRPGLYMAEHFVAQVFMCIQMGVIVTLYMWLQLLMGKMVDGKLPVTLSFLLFYVNYRQLYGYGRLKTLFHVAISFVIFIAIFTSISLIVLVALTVKNSIG